MFKLFKENIAKSALLSGLTIGGLLLLAISLVKAIFILSSESAVQKAEPKDIVLGTLSLGLTLIAMLALLGVQAFLIRKKTFDHKLIIPALIGAGLLLIVATLMVVTKDHEGWTGDWRKLSDIDKARSDIGSNLAIANTLLPDRWGNPMAAPLQNTLTIAQYQDFLNQAISSKQDLASLYAVDELLNKAHEPLIAGKIVDGLAAAWQADHSVTAHSWFASTSTANKYDFLTIVHGLKIGLVDAESFKIIHALLNQPVVYTGITTAYLQGFPVDLAVIATLGLTLVPTLPFVGKEMMLSVKGAK